MDGIQVSSTYENSLKTIKNTAEAFHVHCSRSLFLGLECRVLGFGSLVVLLHLCAGLWLSGFVAFTFLDCSWMIATGLVQIFSGRHCCSTRA